jgi:hypothetical protein
MPRLPASVPAVVDRLRAIDAELAPGDGVRSFNRVYRTVTEELGAGLERPGLFRDVPFMTRMGVVFANLWIEAYDDAAAGRRPSRAWTPLFECRNRSDIYPLQFALAGMNAHIEHDLPLAVVRTCAELGRSPRQSAIRRDYEAVNGVLASVEERIRRSFLDDVSRRVDDRAGPVVHLISSWKIDKARDAAWVTVEALWAMRAMRLLSARFTAALAGTVGMGSRYLLTPMPQLPDLPELDLPELDLPARR